MKKPLVQNIVPIKIKVEIKAVQNHFLRNILIKTEKVMPINDEMNNKINK